MLVVQLISHFLKIQFLNYQTNPSQGNPSQGNPSQGKGEQENVKKHKINNIVVLTYPKWIDLPIILSITLARLIIVFIKCKLNEENLR